MKTAFTVLTGFVLLTSAAFALPTIDGTRDAEYGSALAVQTVQTLFGDANPNGGSELNAAYGLIGGGRLYVMLTGNIEANFNNIEVFIDSKAGGQAVFDSSGNANAGNMDGLNFDSGFTADYHLILRRGNSGTDQFNVDFANLGAQSASGYIAVFGIATTGSGSTGTGVNASTIGVAYDNSNSLGVTAGSAAANQAAAAAVTTGLEFSIALSDLGYVSGDIRVMAGINGAGHDYWSNQFLGGLAAPQGNLGGDGAGNFTGEGALDMTLFAGNQYFVVPEPSMLGLIAVGAGILAGARRRK